MNLHKKAKKRVIITQIMKKGNLISASKKRRQVKKLRTSLVSKRKRSKRIKKKKRSPAVQKRDYRHSFQPPSPAPSAAAHPEISAPAYKDLPFSYNETKLVLLLRDQRWAYGYWDFSTKSWHWIEKFRSADPGALSILRIFNLNKGSHFDLQVELETRRWYIDLGLPDTTFEAQLGLLDSRGRFHLIARSNRIHTPRNSPSPNVDPEWKYTDSEFKEIYKFSGVNTPGRGSEIFSQFRRR